MATKQKSAESASAESDPKKRNGRLAPTKQLKSLERTTRVNIDGVLAGYDKHATLPQLREVHSEQQMLARATRLRLHLAQGKKPIDIQHEMSWTRSYYQTVRRWMTEVFKVELGGMETAEYIGWYRDLVLSEIDKLNTSEQAGKIFKGGDLIAASKTRTEMADMFIRRLLDTGLLAEAPKQLVHKHGHVVATVDDLKGLLATAARYRIALPKDVREAMDKGQNEDTKLLAEGIDGSWGEVIKDSSETEKAAALPSSSLSPTEDAGKTAAHQSSGEDDWWATEEPEDGEEAVKEAEDLDLT